jgi:hypothetical protein
MQYTYPFIQGISIMVNWLVMLTDDLPFGSLDSHCSEQQDEATGLDLLPHLTSLSICWGSHH